MNQSYAFLIAWPETKCKQAGSWYDSVMSAIGVNKNGYYKVGHAAIVLINGDSGKCHYFDFGRYHSPVGYGRVRDEQTDHELKIHTRIEFDEFEKPILHDMIYELNANSSCHGTGELRGGLYKIDFNKAFFQAKQMQEQGSLPYGPFVINGTNCSRFVRTIALCGSSSHKQMARLVVPPMFTPTPMWNVRAVGEYRAHTESIYINS